MISRSLQYVYMVKTTILYHLLHMKIESKACIWRVIHLRRFGSKHLAFIAFDHIKSIDVEHVVWVDCHKDAPCVGLEYNIQKYNKIYKNTFTLEYLP